MKNSGFYAVAAGFFSAAFIFAAGNSPAFAIIPLVSAIFALVIWRKRFKRLAVALCFFAALAAGWIYSLAFSQTSFIPARMLAQNKGGIEARVIAQPVTYTRYASAVVRAKSPAFFLPDPKIAFYYDTREHTLSAGDTLVLSGEFSDARERSSFYAQEGISLFCENAEITSQKCPGKLTLIDLPARAAAEIFARIDQLFEDKKTAGFVRALITGERSRLDSAFESDLSNSGLSHIISLSGMHLAFLAGLLSLFLPKRAVPFIVIPCVWFFSAMTGFPPSVVRAAIMLTFSLAAPVFNREADTATSLSAALILILLLNPYAAASLSLILSFLATLGILLFSKRIADFIGRPFPKSLRRFLRSVISAISVTLSATLLTVPVLALYIGRISLIAPLANVASIWAVEALFILSFLSVIAAFFFPPLANLLAAGVYPLSRYVSESAAFFSGLKFSTLGIPSKYSAILLVLIYLLVFVIIRFKSRRLIVIICSLSLVTSAAFAVAFTKDYREGLVITAIDVGQGQSVLLTMNRETYLFDCGSNNQNISPGDVTANFLRGQNIFSIDHLVISHLDSDHCNGVERLVKSIPVKNAYLPDEEGADALIRLLEENGTRVETVGQSHSVSSEIELSMFVETDVSSRPMLMSYIESGDFSMIITGDADNGQELLLVYLHSIFDVDLVVVGHHGSGSSTSLNYLNYALPEYAVISVGKNNAYGHPSPETLEALEQYEVEVHRTDLEGNITFRVMEDRVSVETSAKN